MVSPSCSKLSGPSSCDDLSKAVVSGGRLAGTLASMPGNGDCWVCIPVLIGVAVASCARVVVDAGATVCTCIRVISTAGACSGFDGATGIAELAWVPRNASDVIFGLVASAARMASS